MKNLIYVALLSLPMFLCADSVVVIQNPVFAVPHQYVGLHVGASKRVQTNGSNSGQKVGARGGLTWGYDFGNQVRAEVEISYREGHKRTQYVERALDEVDHKIYQSTKAWSYMANVIYDVSQLPLWSATPYLGVGVGYAQYTQKGKVKYDTYSDTEKRRDSEFAYQGIVGFRYHVAPGNVMSLQYCYHLGEPHAKNHSVTLGIAKLF